MGDTVTKVMLQAYEQQPEPTSFLAGMFQSPRENFHNSEAVEIDIVRTEEDIAIAIQDLSTGSRMNSEDIFTNKSFVPPVYSEGASINAHTLIKRNPGQDPFMAVDFQANAILRGVRVGRKLNRKIQRAIEYQSAQVLTTGVVTLTNENGSAVYAIDYKPKATHFPTVGTAWSNASSDKLGDLASLCRVIKSDGKLTPDTVIMGEQSFDYFINDAKVQAVFDNRRIEGNGIVPMERMGDGGIYRGVVEIGNWKLDVWTYDGEYRHPQTGTSTRYVPDDKVIVRASRGRLDATFGGIPILATDPRVPAALRSRISVPNQIMDLQFNGFITPDNKSMVVEVGTRPLMIPTAIDTFGCLDTNP